MKNNMKKFLSLLLAVLMMASLSVTAFATEGDFTGDTMTGNYDYGYTVVKKDVYTDFSGVKLTWSVPVLKYVETDVRTWNTDTLQWTQAYEYENAQEVSFKFVNYGSAKVKASVSYASEIADASNVDFPYGVFSCRFSVLFSSCIKWINISYHLQNCISIFIFVHKHSPFRVFHLIS